MILDDQLIERINGLQIGAFRATAGAFAKARPDFASLDLGTGCALFAGEASPFTQVFGMAHRSAGDLGAVESFYKDRTNNWEFTVTPFTERGTARELADRGYRPDHFEAVLAQVVSEFPIAPAHDIIEVGLGDERWIMASSRGWTEDEAEDAEPDEFTRLIAMVPSRRYLALMDGEPAGAASMFEFSDGILLGGATTRVPFRGKGIQSALLKRRLQDAGLGKLALMGAMPGSASHRNAQRVGFAPLYSTVVWMRR